MREYLKYLFIVLSFLLLSSCMKRLSIGRENIILVLADEATYAEYEPYLKDVYNNPIPTPMIENHFILQRASLKDFVRKKIFKNILMLANIDKNSAENNFIKSMFAANILKGVEKGEYFDIHLTDKWARDQYVAILLNSDKFDSKEYYAKYKTKLYNEMRDVNLNRIKKNLFDNHHEKELEDDVRKQYKIDLYIPHDFAFVNKGKKTNFIRFRRNMPDRWLTIIKGKYNSTLSFQENVISLRNEAGKEFGDSVKVNESSSLISVAIDTSFSKTGILLRGVWEYQLGGGPFFTYGFLDKGELILIDGAVYRPGKLKYPYLDQLDLMAKTVKFLD